MTAAPFDTFLSVGGVTLKVVSDDPALASRPRGSLAAFSADAGTADVVISASWTDTLPPVSGERLFHSGGAWQLHRLGDDLAFTFRSSLDGSHPYKIARFNRGVTAGDVRLHRPYFEQHPTANPHPLQYPLDELVMIHVLSQNRGVEVHGCGILDDAGNVSIFVGQSGAGKSTFARLWANRPGVTLLSDERVVLRTDRDPITAYGTPWQGDAHFASPLSGELAAVYFLNKAATHRVVPAASSRAAARLFACSFLPFHNADAVDRTVSAVEQVARRVPCCDLWFAPDPTVADFLLTRQRMG